MDKTVTLPELTKMLGLPDSEMSAVCSWAGVNWTLEPLWTEDEALTLAEEWAEEQA
ncbi:MAG: hypothetical protein ACJ72N_27565 [Labedaea sp.]